VPDLQKDSNVKRHVVNDAIVEPDETGWRLINSPTSQGRYVNAQLDDYDGVTTIDLIWQPPVSLELEARFDFTGESPRGTAGFGFWNAPFFTHARKVPRLPTALWFFFCSAESELPFGDPAIRSGWRAATLDANRLAFKCMLPFAPFGLLPAQNQWLLRRLWPIARNAIGAAETTLAQSVMREFHSYRIEWLEQQVRFYVDDTLCLRSPYSPRGRLGAVLWIDNQFMVVRPQGSFSYGQLALSDSQVMIVRNLVLKSAIVGARG
jgi:hypothetical protein